MNRQVVGLCTALAVVGAGCALYFFGQDRPPEDPPRDGEVAVTARPEVPSGWLSVQRDEVVFATPRTWVRQERARCMPVVPIPRWAPPDVRTCGLGTSITLYPEGGFDPLVEPDVLIRTRKTPEGRLWSAYTYRGDYAVIAVGPERDLVRALLRHAAVRSSA